MRHPVSTPRWPWIVAIGTAASIALSSASAAAHHGSEDASDVRSIMLWVGAAVVVGVLVVLRLVTSRRRRPDESADGDE